jgi:hypothetical protein
VRGYRKAIQENFTTIRGNQAGHKIEGCRLAGAIGTEQANHLTGTKFQADIGNKRATTEGDSNPIEH